MKIKIAIYLLLIFTLVACKQSSANTTQQAEQQLTATQTELPPTATKVPFTPTPRPPATETPAMIPDYMADFIARGYDQQPISGDSMYLVVHEEEMKIGPPGKGWIVILPNGDKLHILSVVPASYIEDNQEKIGWLIDTATRRADSDGVAYIFYMTRSSSVQVDPSIRGVAPIKGIDDGWTDHTEGDYILSQAFSSVEQSGINELFDGFQDLLPSVSEGELPMIDIPGLGKVFPFIRVKTLP